MRATDVAHKLKPYILNWVGEGAGQQNVADYVIYLSGSACLALNTRSGSIDFTGSDHASVIQSAIQTVGVGGTIFFRSGTYLLSAALSPLSGQTWLVVGCIFQPTGNNSVLSFFEVDHFTLLGALRIQDPFGVTTSVPAITGYSLRYTLLQRIFIVNYFRGMDLEGNLAGAGTNENTFLDLYMQVRDRGVNLAGSCHDNHFIQLWVKGPAPNQHATGAGVRVATDGTQGGNTFDHVQCLDMHTGLDFPGAFEIWVGSAIIDNSFSLGIFLSGSVERIFFVDVWVSSGGDGIIIEGNDSALPTTYAFKIHIDRLYAWLNANYGVRLKGYVKQLTLDTVVVQRNYRGFIVEGTHNEDIIVGTLVSLENELVGVDASGVNENCFINNALVYDSIIGRSNFTELKGARPGVGLFQNQGVALMLGGSSTAVVHHGLEGTPSMVFVTGEHVETSAAYVQAKDASTLTIAVPSAVTADRAVFWQAISGRKAGPELLLNPDVELEENGAPVGWFSSVSGASWDTVTYYSEYHSLRLQVNGATADWRSLHFPVIGHATYRVRGLFQGAGSTHTFLTIRWFDDPGGTGFLGEQNVPLDGFYTLWTAREQDFISPPGAQSADLLFRCPTPTTADIYGDDFSVRVLV